MSEHILIVEDEAAIACDIAMNLEDHGFHIAGVVHSVTDALQILEGSKKIDLVMLDINLEGEQSGIDLALILDEQYGTPFIFLTSYSDQETVSSAAGTFPASYLVKPFRENDLAPAVRIALAGKKGNNVYRIPPLGVINKAVVADLTSSEYQIIKEIWQGKSNIEIADSSFISKNTVKTHIRNVYAKLNVHSRTALIKYLRDLK
jgi:DNA-binding NarL/FixJ family response regulator